MYSKLIILKNIELDNEYINDKFKGFSGEIVVLDNFTTNIFDMYDNSELTKFFNFNFIEDNVYLQITSDIFVNKSLIDKLNSDNSIRHNSSSLKILRLNDKNKINIEENIDYNSKENITLSIKEKIDYDKTSTLLFIHKHVSFKDKVLDRLISSVKNGKLVIYCYIEGIKEQLENKYKNLSIEFINTDAIYEDMNNKKLAALSNKNIDNLIFLDNNIILKENIDLIKLLVQTDKHVTTHFLSMFNSNYNNLWFDKDHRGYYKRSTKSYKPGNTYDSVYMNYIMYINTNKLRSLLENKQIYDGINNKNIPIGDFDIVISNFFTNNNMKIANIYSDDIGYIIGDSKYIGDKYMNLKDIEANRYCWLEEYIDSNCLDVLFNSRKPEFTEPIPWLFETMFATPKFCVELKELVNSFELWSDGSNNDSRLQSGYEPVPTVDVHLNQVGFRDIWDNMLKTVIGPLCEKFFVGFNTKGTNISFVVKYSMDGQKHLRPHHDASSYTINVALNDQTEYTGGGTHFIVSDYKKIGAPIGTMLIHPGRCTHYHSGLPITSGERYILVGFIE